MFSFRGTIIERTSRKILKKSHSDIVESFEKLKTIGFIEIKEKIISRGRPQNKFKITKKE